MAEMMYLTTAKERLPITPTYGITWAITPHARKIVAASFLPFSWVLLGECEFSLAGGFLGVVSSMVHGRHRFLTPHTMSSFERRPA